MYNLLAVTANVCQEINNNENLLHGGGVVRALSDASGLIIQEESYDWIKKKKKGKFRSDVTAIDMLPAFVIIHESRS